MLVHGTPSSSYLWRNVVPMLADRFSVYVFDLLGYGGSPAAADADVSIPVHADVLGALLEEWGIEAPAIAGHDIGGATVLRAHLLGRVPFGAIALLDAVAFAPWVTPTTRHIQAHLETYRTMPTHIFEQVVAAHVRTAVHGVLDEDALARYLRPWTGEAGQAAYLAKVANFKDEHTREFEPLLGTIGVPVQIIWGEEDAWLAPALGKRLSDLIPGAQLKLVPRAGHFVMEDAPADVAELLLEFFSATARPR